MFGMDASVLTMGLHENYPSRPMDAETAARVAEAFSDADVVDRHLYAKQAWHCYELYGACAVAAPSLAMHAACRPAPRLSVTKFGSLWSRVCMSCTRAKQLRAIADRCAVAGATAYDACDVGNMVARLRAVVERGDGDDAVREVTWPLTGADVINAVRMTPGGAPWFRAGRQVAIRRALAGRN